MTTGNDFFADFDAAQARIEAIAAQARANTVHASRIADDVRTATATARSPRGEISVVSRVGGVIASVEYSDAAFDLAPGALARITVETIARAQHAASVQFADRASDELGADSALADGLRADAERAFPSPGDGLQ